MKDMNKSLLPAMAGFWLGYLLTSALLFGWALLGIYLYFMDSTDLWYDVAGVLLALPPLLMAGGLTRKFRPGLRAGGLWAAAALNALVLLGFVLLGGDACWLTIPGEVLAAWAPPLMARLGTFPYDTRMLARDVVGLFLPSLVFTLGYLLARRSEGPGGRQED